jgi:hypothetical protein
MSNPEYNSALPELDFFLNLRYDLLLTVKPEGRNYFGNKNSFIQAHEMFSRRLFGSFNTVAKVRKEDLYYFGRSEFGLSQLAHLHLLFSLDRCRDLPVYRRYKESLIDYTKDSLKFLFSKHDFYHGVFQIHCTTTGDSHSDGSNLASYLCKEKYAPFRDKDLQNFVFPKKNTDEAFVKRVRQREHLDAQADLIPAKTAWRAEVRNGKWQDLAA